MADAAARSLQYEYKANSNLVLQVKKNKSGDFTVTHQATANRWS